MEGQEKEIWKSVVGYEGCYSISTCGKIKRMKAANRTIVGKELRLFKNRKGYLSVSLCENNKHKTWIIHRLVAITFLGNPPKGLQVNHIDGIKTNNHVSNLEYVTPGQNTRHGWELGLCESKNGEKCPAAKLKKRDVLKIRKLYSSGNFTTDNLGKKFKVSGSNIGYIVKYKTWKYIKPSNGEKR